jgi:hypothetical protein
MDDNDIREIVRLCETFAQNHKPPMWGSALDEAYRIQHVFFGSTCDGSRHEILSAVACMTKAHRDVIRAVAALLTPHTRAALEPAEQQDRMCGVLSFVRRFIEEESAP